MNETRPKWPPGLMRKVMTRAYIHGESAEEVKRVWGSSFDEKVWEDIAMQVNYFEENNPLFRHETAEHFNATKEDCDLDLDR